MLLFTVTRFGGILFDSHFKMKIGFKLHLFVFLKGNPILARIKKKPMNRMTSVPPPTTPTGGPPGGQVTAPPPPPPPAAGGAHQMTAPSPGAPNPAQSPQSKNGYGERC